MPDCAHVFPLFLFTQQYLLHLVFELESYIMAENFSKAVVAGAQSKSKA